MVIGWVMAGSGALSLIPVTFEANTILVVPFEALSANVIASASVSALPYSCEPALVPAAPPPLDSTVTVGVVAACATEPESTTAATPPPAIAADATRRRPLTLDRRALPAITSPSSGATNRAIIHRATEHSAM